MPEALEADIPLVDDPEVVLGDDEDVLEVLGDEVLGDEVLLVLPVEPDPLVDPEADVEGVVDVEEVELPLPIVDEPEAPAELIEAFVSVQLSSVPCRHPVTVTVRLLDGLLSVELLVPLVPVVLPPVVLSEPVLCVPLCAATLTAKAQANATPVAGPNTRFMWSSSWLGEGRILRHAEQQRYSRPRSARYTPGGSVHEPDRPRCLQ